MVVGLQPLEFTDCILDSPDFRENLNKHEKELEKTSQQIKRIIKEVKDLLAASKNLSRAQRTLAKSLAEFNFECIGSTQTDDEQVIVDSLKQFSRVITNIEDERDNVLARAHDQIVAPLENFRKDRIGGVKENKKKFDKKTAKFCQAQERFLNLSSKKADNTIQEADASLGMLEREYLRESLSYVFGIQDVQERIKFEFVETLLSFMSGWLLFYHLGYEASEESRDYMNDLQHKVQKTRENFDETRTKAEQLKSKYMDSKMKPDTEYTKQGYLFLMEKSKIKAFTATWSKYYCTYKKQYKQFKMLAYNQISGRTELPPENLTLVQCIRRASDFEKRFCFDLIFEQKPGVVLTFQALSEEDRRIWLNAMDGKEPTYLPPGITAKNNGEYLLDEIGFSFIRKCIEILENRGLEEEGIYRVGGVNTKITKLIQLGMDKHKTEFERHHIFSDDQYADLLETKTIASALKHYLRHLSEPLMTFRYHNGFIAAAKQDMRIRRISDVHTLVYRIPKPNFEMLDIVIKHLKNVTNKSHKNKMSVFNVGVVFGPTLLRSVEETLAAILDIKFNNVIIEILIENYDLIFKNAPDTLLSTSLPNISNDLAIYQNVNNNKNDDNTINTITTTNIAAASNTTNNNNNNNNNNNTNNNINSNNPNSISKNNNNINEEDDDESSNNNNYITNEAISDLNLSNETIGFPVRNIELSLINQQQQQQQQQKLAAQNQRINLLRCASESNLFNVTTTPPKTTTTTTASTTNSSHLSSSVNNSTITDNKLQNSTSSSNESVYSASSLNYINTNQHSQNPSSFQHKTGSKLQITIPSTATTTTTNIDHNNSSLTSGSFLNFRENGNNLNNILPKKSQRTKNNIRNKFNSPRDNVRVRTLYACLAENDGELSFEPNQIITNVRSSNEPGWLEGTLNGKSGLIPENYVEVLP